MTSVDSDDDICRRMQKSVSEVVDTVNMRPLATVDMVLDMDVVQSRLHCMVE